MTTQQSGPVRPILLAGILGGLLGGAGAFAAVRYIKPSEAKPDAAAAQSSSEAREVADAYVAKLKAAKFDEFANDAKQGLAFANDVEFTAFKKKLSDNRLGYAQNFGPSTSEFEFLRETTLSQSLARFVYLEKFERGGVLWIFVLYRGKHGWRLSWVEYGGIVANIFAGLS